MTLKLHENGYKFSQTWLIGILARYFSFENRYYIFGVHKNVWRYQNSSLLRHIREKPDGRFAPMGVLPHVTLLW